MLNLKQKWFIKKYIDCNSSLINTRNTLFTLNSTFKEFEEHNCVQTKSKNTLQITHCITQILL